MIYEVSEKQSSKLLRLPETGMGFQVVEAEELASDRISTFLVLNSQLAIDVDRDLRQNKRLIAENGFKTLLRRSDVWDVKTSSIRVVPEQAIREPQVIAEAKSFALRRSKVDGGATENELEHADGDEKFVRLSAYKDDKRIDFENDCLLPGSYCTSERDYLDCVNTHDDPLDRYALPTDEEIEWAFFIQPNDSDTFRRGIVQPAFGHQGGGEEAYFENGTSDDTYLYRRAYGSA